MRVIIFLALLGTALAVPKSISRIVGGSPTTVQEYPYMSNMQYGFWGIWWFQACAVTVLRSGVCAWVPPSHPAVALSTQCPSWSCTSSTTPTPSTMISPLSVWPTPAVYSNSVQPASVAGSAYNLPDNTLVTTIGWGTTSSGGSAPEQLQHVDINIINQQLCAERYAYLKTQPGYQNWPDITDNMLCAGILNAEARTPPELASPPDNRISRVCLLGLPVIPASFSVNQHASSMRLLIFLALLGSALAVPRNPSRIVGGTETTVEEYPYMVNMQYSSSGIKDADWQWRVVLGTSFRNGEGGSVHTIQRVIIHPQYIDKIWNNDVAIVRFTGPAVFSNTVQQARIPGTQYNVADGSLVTHVGWGHQWTNGPHSEQLLHVHVNVINQEECAARYAYLKTQPAI
ncbi:hypothetical protein SFRURICE_013876 [Spodoptera frugiperda]|nr:hypothetical protein SFRURICE_013876 [Spodoptera frugiperda]